MAMNALFGGGGGVPVDCYAAASICAHNAWQGQPSQAEQEQIQAVMSQMVEKKFEGDSKGFEGAISLRGADGVLYILGLC